MLRAMPLGHLGINVPNLAHAKQYYDTVMPLLGYETFLSGPDEFAYKPADGKIGTYIFFYPSLAGGEYSRHRTGLQHLAFMVKSRDVVDEVHRVVVALGSEVVHEPREFPEYHPGYYATFWLDPHGQMLEAVCHKTPTGEA
jgi:catechol 2,3-dioxygenase-like lactoylglutathione lyase family enzyme